MTTPILYDAYNKPVKNSSLSSASLDSGTFRGSISSYYPTRNYTYNSNAFERTITQNRAEDLFFNDSTAKSAVNSIVTNAVGTGLRPQSNIPAKLLGISRAEAVELQEQMEWAWTIWCANAHFGADMQFEDLQALGLKSIIRSGEMIHLPVMIENDSPFNLKIQTIAPERLCTPNDKQNDTQMRDGVELDSFGRPVAYWIASPKASNSYVFTMNLHSDNFTRIPAKVGHRKGIFHIFKHEKEEQYRGYSGLSSGIKLFRHLNDSIDHELLAQVMISSFPLLITSENAMDNLPYTQNENQKQYYQDIAPGQITYLNPGEDLKVAESSRPSQNFLNFCELIQRQLAASLEIPYEVLTKDFSKTNYSSARAAMLEAWRVFLLYRDFFVRHYCQNIWEMVQEEAILRGLVKLPKIIQDFYSQSYYLFNARWIGPARGYIDPIKEITANIKAIDAKLMTRSEALAERGNDFVETMDEFQEEQEYMQKIGLNPSLEEEQNNVQSI